MSLATLNEALRIVLTPPTIYYIAIGVTIGILVGGTPGIGSALGMAVLLPLTTPLDGISAIILLAGIYSGAMYGGSLSAIVINVPGTGAAAATTLDGYPLTKQGKVIDAISISIFSSVLGGVIGFSLVILSSPVLIDIVRLFGTPEYFLVTALGLAMITLVSQGSIVKGITAGAFGFLLTTIGIAPSTPEVRYSLGLIDLFDGISYIAVLLGLFAVGEMIQLSKTTGGIAEENVEITGSFSNGFFEVIKRPILVVKSAVIGLIIGAIPGAGASVSNFISYIEAMRSSKTPELFGKGSSEGIIASESSNNATVGGSIVPTIAFGIPGSGATAVLLGGLIMHGLQPGPQMFTTDLRITYSLYLGLILGNVVIFTVGVLLLKRIHYITSTNTNVIIPIVVVVSTVGAYSVRSNWVDVVTLLLLGYLGFFMKKHDYSIIAFLLGVILGSIAETTLIRSLHLSDGSFLIFVSSPLSIVLTVLLVLVLFTPLIRYGFKKRGVSQ